MQAEGKASQADYKVTHVPEALKVPKSSHSTGSGKPSTQLMPQSSSTSTSTTSTTSSSTSTIEGMASGTSHFSKKSNLTAKQREQTKDVPLVGQNPGNVKTDNGIIFVDTELLGGLPAAQQKFKELTGQNLPTKIPKPFIADLPNEVRVVYRELGKSNHPKIEITTTIANGQKILEKITFR